MKNSTRLMARVTAMVALVGVGAVLPSGTADAQRPRSRSPLILRGMVVIKGATFMMGCSNAQESCSPRHSVTVSTFAMDRFETTVAKYRACVQAGKCSSTDLNKITTSGLNDARCNWNRAGADHHPINCLTWAQAKAYCTWKGKRLPSEKEWEFAARGRKGRLYPWGNAAVTNQACFKTWTDTPLNGNTCKVGQHPAGNTPNGLRDMAGNVLEFTSNAWSPRYNRKPTRTKKVARGGCGFMDMAGDRCKSYRRTEVPVSSWSGMPWFGMRCAISAPTR